MDVSVKDYPCGGRVSIQELQRGQYGAIAGSPMSQIYPSIVTCMEVP